jgi:hypothetical protein
MHCNVIGTNLNSATNTSTEKFYTDGYEHIYTGVFRSVGTKSQYIEKNHYLYGQITENRKWKSIFTDDRSA